VPTRPQHGITCICSIWRSRKPPRHPMLVWEAACGRPSGALAHPATAPALLYLRHPCRRHAMCMDAQVAREGGCRKRPLAALAHPCATQRRHGSRSERCRAATDRAAAPAHRRTAVGPVSTVPHLCALGVLCGPKAPDALPVVPWSRPHRFCASAPGVAQCPAYERGRSAQATRRHVQGRLH